jgi:hypothetical protein
VRSHAVPFDGAINTFGYTPAALLSVLGIYIRDPKMKFGAMFELTLRRPRYCVNALLRTALVDSGGRE